MNNRAIYLWSCSIVVLKQIAKMLKCFVCVVFIRNILFVGILSMKHRH